MIPTITVFDCSVKLREKYIKNNYPELYNILVEFPDDYSWSERLYLYYNGLPDRPKCQHCMANHTKFISLIEGYRKFCSQECCGASADRSRKAATTRINRSQKEKEETRNKTNQTCLERYGGVGFASEELNDKARKTCQERYGEREASKVDEIKKKIISSRTNRSQEEKETTRNKTNQTCLEKYGGVGFASEELNNKARKTCWEKYGDPNYNNLEKFKQTCLEKYGEDNPMKSDVILEKARKTNNERYGVDWVMKNSDIASRNSESRNKSYIDKSDFVVDIVDGEWVCKCPHPGCDKCKEKTYRISSIRYYGRKRARVEPCTNLLKIHPDEGTSIELFVRDILDKSNIKYINNYWDALGNREIDIYVPDKRIGIECNGVYYHSLENSPSNMKRHMNKWKDCKEKGIQLITVWEDQIKTKPEIVKSVVLSKLGVYEKRIGARKCEIKEISSRDAAEFLEKNHIQGRTNASVHIGLYYEGSIVGVMTFAKRSKVSGGQKASPDEWELNRFCTLLNTQIVGGAGKLLKYFIKKYNPKSIVSFASNDVSNGGVYEKLGFERIGDVTDAYWYVDKETLKRYHRSNFTKSRLKEMGWDVENETESKIMSKLPYFKIYDSGHIKYILKNGI